MNPIAIKIQQLSKYYDLYTRTDVKSFVLGSLKRSNKQSFCALHDINFEVAKGEVLGIIGPNGSGKSTLLKIISEVSPPSTGAVEVRGTVASLLEIGVGFNPELTGRENIELTAGLYGINKSELKTKLPMIVELFGFGQFIDTPVKYFSNGMYMRLAFAVVIHIDADIYLLDEVLSVGDNQFRDSVQHILSDLKSQGKTILFVTHNPNELINICDRFLLLINGVMKKIGAPDEVLLEELHVFSSTDLVNIHCHKESENPKAQYINKQFSEVFYPQSTDMEFYGDEVVFKYRFLVTDAPLFEQTEHILLIKDVATRSVAQLVFSNAIMVNNNSIELELKLPLSFFGPYSFWFDIMAVHSDKVVYMLPHVLLHKFERQKLCVGMLNVNVLK